MIYSARSVYPPLIPPSPRGNASYRLFFILSWGKKKSWPSYIASSFSMTIAKGRDTSYDALPQLLLIILYKMGIGNAVKLREICDDFCWCKGYSGFSGYLGFSRFLNELMTLASISSFGKPEQPEKPENLEQPITTSGIIPANANP